MTERQVIVRESQDFVTSSKYLAQGRIPSRKQYRKQTYFQSHWYQQSLIPQDYTWIRDDTKSLMADIFEVKKLVGSRY